MAIRQNKAMGIMDKITLRVERVGLDIGIPLGSETLF